MAIYAAIQMVSGDDLAQNLTAAERLIEQAAKQGARLVVLPENFALFSTLRSVELGQLEISAQGKVRKFLSECAKKYGVWIVGGSLPVASGEFNTELNIEKVFSACFVLDNAGREVDRYNKIHLFDAQVKDNQHAYRESDAIAPGRHITVVDTPFGRLGVAVCYDLRFPELFRLMFQQGVDLIAVPAAFTQVTGDAHWVPLLRARAIENQVTIIGANQGGVHNSKRETYGHSMIVNSWGEVIAQLEKGAGVVCGEIEPSEQQKGKAKLAIAQHQRLFVSADIKMPSQG